MEAPEPTWGGHPNSAANHHTVPQFPRLQNGGKICGYCGSRWAVHSVGSREWGESTHTCAKRPCANSTQQSAPFRAVLWLGESMNVQSLADTCLCSVNISHGRAWKLDEHGLEVRGVRATPRGEAAQAHRSLKAAACLCLTLQLQEECGEPSGMSLWVCNRPPNLSLIMDSQAPCGGSQEHPFFIKALSSLRIPPVPGCHAGFYP